MTVTPKALGADTFVTISGAVRIQEADGFSVTLKEILALPCPVVTLDLADIESVDVTFFQVLLAFQLSLTSQNRRLLVRRLAAGHPVGETAQLLGLEMSQHFTLAGDPS